MTESSQVSKDGDGTFHLLAGLLAHGGPHCLLQRGNLRVMIILAVKGGKVRAVDRPKPAPLEHLVQFVEKEVWHEELVT